MFYKTLYYNLLDQNKLDLVLELSNAALTDSVSFEQVTGNGQLIKIYGSQKTLAATNIYHQLTEMLDAGITYIRARIRLQNGFSVYTDIIQVLTTGSGKIRFIPIRLAAVNSCIIYCNRVLLQTAGCNYLTSAAGWCGIWHRCRTASISTHCRPACTFINSCNRIVP